jgi:hypothetical protein
VRQRLSSRHPSLLGGTRCVVNEKNSTKIAYWRSHIEGLSIELHIFPSIGDRDQYGFEKY